MKGGGAVPFTFAHPAIMIPLIHKRPKWIDTTALIFGSMAPEFEYFIRFKAQAVVGHMLSGFLFFNLPFLKQYIVIFGMKIAVYKILQHGSTLVIGYRLYWWHSE